MARAAFYLQEYGADLIDINCGCPKTKIRKKGAGSALLDTPEHLLRLISTVREAISIPLTVKIRIQGNEQDFTLARGIAAAGADALIVHGRRWTEDYDVPANWQHIGLIKKEITIPVIANGDIADKASLTKAQLLSACDGLMIARAGCGKPWLYEELLTDKPVSLVGSSKTSLFLYHLQQLAALESEFKAVLQSKSLIRYYFKNYLTVEQLAEFYQLTSLKKIEQWCTDRTI